MLLAIGVYNEVHAENAQHRPQDDRLRCGGRQVDPAVRHWYCVALDGMNMDGNGYDN
jgi:hypothetical protein